MLSCNFFLLSLSFVAFASASDLELDGLASASDLELDGLTFNQYNLLSSYYLFRHSKQIGGWKLSLPLTKYCDFARGFYSKSPKDCLAVVRDARDNFFSSFFLKILLSAPNYRLGIINHFRIIKKFEIPEVKGLVGELPDQFKDDCNKVAKDLWFIPFIKYNRNEYLERVEAFEILLCIMKRFAVVLQEGETKKSLLVSYNSLKFVLRNFKVNADHVPSYEGFLITFNTLRSLSRTHKGEWPNGSDITTVVNLIKLFRFYSHHFSHNHFNELPTTVPSLLLSLMLVESWVLTFSLFSLFSKDPLSLPQVSFDSHPFSDLYSRITPFYLDRKMKNQKTTIVPRNLYEERGFFIFLRELITLEPEIIPILVVNDGPPIALSLSERDKWLIKVFLKLHGIKHHHNLYLTE